MFPVKRVRTATLDIAYEEHGPAAGYPVILLHGFPYDPRCYDAVAPILAAAGFWVIVPYLRGYGPTRFLSDATFRSGQQAALALDLRDLMDALAIPRAVLAGYDWGGRAACILAALWPERATGLVTGGGYNIQNISTAETPVTPETEHRFWYQYYLHSARGRAGLAAHRRDFCRLLWRLWSPAWRFDDATFDRTAESFDNPDFVDVVVHSYRHRYGVVPGDPAMADIERALAAQPLIAVPTISLIGGDDGVAGPVGTDMAAQKFTNRYERRVLPGIGHNVPQEAPEVTAGAVLDLARG
jgi:pimeloyl-ACP methyl ester carboxylesterase